MHLGKCTTSKSVARVHLYYNMMYILKKKSFYMGRGCDTIDRAVSSNSRETKFESSHRQLLMKFYLQDEEIKEKEAGMAH